MARIHLSGASRQQRLLYAKQVEPVRRLRGMSQEALGEAANTSRNTIGNIETGAVVPQEDVLRRVFRALGIATDTDGYSDETESWLAMFGALIELIEHGERQDVVDEAARLFAATARLHPVGTSSDAEAREAVPDLPDDVTRRQRDEHDLAADEGADEGDQSGDDRGVTR